MIISGKLGLQHHHQFGRSPSPDFRTDSPHSNYCPRLSNGAATDWIAQDIVNLAFGLLFGAIAVASAIAFGLGGREIAGQQVREILESFKQQRNLPPRG
nr:hypothetical protein [Chroococcidiopsis cubana]